MPTKHTSHWLIDAVLFTGLIAAFFLGFTGLVISSWLDLTLFKYGILAHDPFSHLDRDLDLVTLKIVLH
jgi:hypothetical protein